MSKLPDLTDGIRALRGEFDDEVMRLKTEIQRLRLGYFLLSSKGMITQKQAAKLAGMSITKWRKYLQGALEEEG